MSPTPVTFTTPNAPATYSWEATDEEVAARYGIDQATDRPVRPQHLPHPTGARRPAAGSGPVRGPAVGVPADRLPPTRRRGRRALWREPGRDPGRCRGGRDPRHRGQGLHPGRRHRRHPDTDLRDVPRPDRAAASDRHRCPAPGRGGRLGDRPGRRPRCGPDHQAAVVWLCSPNNPTALPEPDGAIEALLVDLAADAAAAGREPPVVVLDEAYAEFVGSSLVGLRATYPNLVVVRTASKAYALAGLRVGFAVARPEVIARLNPFRPPGSVSTVSVTLVTEALLDPDILERQPRPRRARARAA